MSSSPSSSSSSDAPASLDAMRWVMDVPSPVDIVLGTTTVKVRECATLAVDTVIRLKQAAGSDLEVRVGGIPMFAGEVVMAGDDVSLRIGRVLPPAGQEIA